ncbi:hypothetical protein CK556_02435 [Mesoplasma chauliocola]|uniref:HTH rpiR-type domain-containing protein n=2 Tax=Mesoplasma chauliocola TaxID=216427 RepID=A0A249SNL3_9MOLU|nr:hypothetical protein [Mesoplasma chauliocola]ASZ09202.1 hypothetical protein CK556_02435 [Mesoplasma chauliocola]
MFESIREKLNSIYESNEISSHKLIAKYLIDCLDNDKTPTTKECSEVCFISESALTAFSKKYGYQGFREIAVRIKVERELYKPFKKDTKRVKTTNVRELVNKYFDQIDLQEDQLNKLVNKIKDANKVYLISSYEQEENVNLFSSELHFKNIEAYFTKQKRLEDMWIEKCEANDLSIFLVCGLDNQSLTRLYTLAKEQQKNIFIISSSSQSHKFKEENSIILQQECDMEIYLSIRSIVINYLFAKILSKL